MAARVTRFALFFWEYLKMNVGAAVEYRVSTVSQIIGMFVNDIIWVLFWALYFQKFPVLQGWELEDVMIMWAVLTTSFGIVGGLFTNCLRIPGLVVQGQLDYYLALPKNPLLHLLVSQIRPVNLGDLLFGPILLAFMVDLTWSKTLIFLLCIPLCATLMLGFFVALGSLTFFLGNAETLAGQVTSVFIHFTTYPAPIFDNAVKVVLFTLIPAGFVSSLPVALMREFQLGPYLQLLGGALFFLGLGIWLFHAGLKRYESGNLMVMRS